ncbi:MAG: DUF1924 domain-containing protein [Thermodesulfobacteriota bacterium]
MNRKSIILSAVFAAVLFAFTALAGAAPAMNRQIDTLMSKYRKEAGVKTFSAEAGREFFNRKRVHSKGEVRSCSRCHTSNPANKGRTPVGKVIEPMAPSVNPERFTDPKKVEKWFRRNCRWVLERECTPEEKGNYLTFMFSL